MGSALADFTFTAVIGQDPDGYWAYCPVLQGCYAQEESYNEALANLREAVELHVENRLASGKEIPQSGTVSLINLRALCDSAGSSGRRRGADTCAQSPWVCRCSSGRLGRVMADAGLRPETSTSGSPLQIDRRRRVPRPGCSTRSEAFNNSMPTTSIINDYPQQGLVGDTEGSVVPPPGWLCAPRDDPAPSPRAGVWRRENPDCADVSISTMLIPPTPPAWCAPWHPTLRC